MSIRGDANAPNHPASSDVSMIRSFRILCDLQADRTREEDAGEAAHATLPASSSFCAGRSLASSIHERGML